jgi:AAA15 family ATPase/GTPase
MPIKILRIKNFKSIKDLELRCKKINIFIGEPNTGKSNILEAIGLLSYSSYGTQSNLGQFVRYESMTNLFYDHILGDPITISYDESALTIQFKNGRFIGGFCPNPQQTVDFFSLDYTRVTSFRPEPSFRSFKFYRFLNHRSFPNQDSEFLKPSDGRNLMAIIMTNKRIKEISKEIFGKFGYRLIIRPEESKIEVAKESEDVLISFPYSLASETLQRLIFYIAAINSNQESTITLEEPEAHAFPYYTKYLAERIALGNGNNQYFIATHNPYFLTSILEKSPKEEVAIFITYLDHYQTKARLLDEAQKEKILEMGSEDVFFNIDKFLSLKD